MTEARIAVVGAGVVGLACAARLARAGHQVVVLERHARFGQETSSRNSEVIHAGLYYPTGSLKARTCVEGRALLYERCRTQHIEHRKIGKLVVAVEPRELPALETLYARALANGAGDVRLVERDELRALEPEVRAERGLFSPETGIVDAHGFMASLAAEATSHGALFAYHHELCAIEGQHTLSLTVADDRGERSTVEVDWLVNVAGLASDRISALSGVDVAARKLRLYPCKGDYFTLAGELRGLTRHLVYPMAEQAGLGIHITHDLAGNLRAGPDVEYVAAPHYDVSETKRTRFAEAIRRYLPRVRDDQLTPAYAGVRPKLAAQGEAFRDFVCDVFAEAPRTVQLVGIESPGLTAALALAERVAARIDAE